MFFSSTRFSLSPGTGPDSAGGTAAAMPSESAGRSVCRVKHKNTKKAKYQCVSLK